MQKSIYALMHTPVLAVIHMNVSNLKWKKLHTKEIYAFGASATQVIIFKIRKPSSWELCDYAQHASKHYSQCSLINGPFWEITVVTNAVNLCVRTIYIYIFLFSINGEKNHNHIVTMITRDYEKKWNISEIHPVFGDWLQTKNNTS